MRYHTENSKRPSLSILISLVICMIMIIISVCIFLSTRSEQSREEDTNISSEIRTICELATIRAYYHNVADFSKEPDGLFKYGLFQYGYKKIWMEYSGIVEVGIDVNEVKVSEPDEAGVVELYVPDARVLNVDADPETLSKPLVETGVLTDISAADEAEAFSAAQTNMEEEAKSNRDLLSQAKGRAKELLEEYVINTGKQMGVQYTVKWVDQ